MPVLKRLFVASVVILGAVSPVLAAESVAVTPVVHDELNRALDDLVGQVHGLGERWRDHFRRVDSPAERPLITAHAQLAPGARLEHQPGSEPREATRRLSA